MFRVLGTNDVEMSSHCESSLGSIPFEILRPDSSHEGFTFLVLGLFGPPNSLQTFGVVFTNKYIETLLLRKHLW